SISNINSGEFSIIRNKNGEIQVNSVESLPPLLSANTNGTVEISLDCNAERLVVTNGKLSTVDIQAIEPLNYSPTEHNLSISIDDTYLQIVDGKLSAKSQQPTLSSP